MFFKIYSPPEILADYVQLIWILEEELPNNIPDERIVADGIVELVFHYGQPFATKYENGSPEIQPRSFAIAQFSKPITIQPTGKTGIIAARFYPWGAFNFFNFPVREMGDKTLSAREIWGNSICDTESELNRAGDSRTRVNIVSDFLTKQFLIHHKNKSNAENLVKYIYRTSGSNNMSELSQRTGLGQRRMERLLNNTVGVSPKHLSRIARFLGSCRQLKNGMNKDLSQIGLELGYFDHAHFVHEFKQFSGVTPSTFLRANDIAYLEL